MRSSRALRAVGCAWPVVLAASNASAAISVSNIIPFSFSRDTSQNAEPSIALDSNARNTIVTPFSLTGLAAGTNPYFTSHDGGATWLKLANQNYTHGDTTADISPGGIAYAGFLRNGGTQIDVESSPKINEGTAFANNLGNQSTLGPRVPPAVSPDPDQPWVRVARVGGVDSIYVGLNDVGARDGAAGNMGKTATIHYAAADGANPWRQVALDHIGTPRIGGAGTDFLGDAPSVRVATAGNRVYSIFQRYTGTIGGSDDRNGEVVIVRDDAPGVGGVRAFTSIPNAGGNANNESKVSGAAAIRLPGAGANATLLGNYEKIRSAISIAVDPTDSDIVYVAYTEVVTVAGNNQPRIKVMRSQDKGETWNPIAAAVQGGVLNSGPTALPAMAVSNDHTLGLLYYLDDPTNNRATVNFLQYSHATQSGGTSPLCSFSTAGGSVLQAAVNNQFSLGDYIDLEAVGSDFHGAFIASNDLNDAVFNQGTPKLHRNFDQPGGVFRLLDPKGMPLGGGSFSLDPWVFTTKSAVPAAHRWNKDTNTDVWSNAANWDTGIVPNSTSATANFFGNITANRTVTNDAAHTVQAIHFDTNDGPNAGFSYTIAGNNALTLQTADANFRASLHVVTGSHTISAPLVMASKTDVIVGPAASTLTAAGGVTLNAGVELVNAGAGTFKPKVIKAAPGARTPEGAGLTVGVKIDSGTIQILPDGTAAATSRIGTLSIAGGPAAPTARLDLTNNALVLDYEVASPFADVRSYVIAGRAGGAWTGQGITSSLANSSTHGVGYAEASALGSAAPIFGTVDSTSVLVRYTRYGDADLSGTVNLLDFNAMAANFGLGGRVWSQGDFTYDGFINLLDFNALAANFGLSAGPDGVVDPADWANLASAVPEPGSLLMFLPLALPTLARRAQRRPKLA